MGPRESSAKSIVYVQFTQFEANNKEMHFYNFEIRFRGIVPLLESCMYGLIQRQKLKMNY